jgi:hypothetical protein
LAGDRYFNKKGQVKLVLLAQTFPLNEMTQSNNSFLLVSKIETLTENIVIIKNAIILNIIHDIFNLRDTEVLICIILVLLKRSDGLNNHLNIRYNTKAIVKQ